LYYPLTSNPAGYITSAALTGYVPNTRTLTINGTSYDLSADRSWTIPAGGTVTSVELAAGTGISLSGTNPITTSGTITVTNDAPDQVVSLSTTGTGLSVTGTYPTFTLENTLPDQTVVLTPGTGIGITGTYPSFTIDNTAPGVTYTVDNGLESQATPTPDPNNFQLGGPLVRDTIIGGAAKTYGIDFSELSYITGTTDQLNVVADDGTDNTQLDISSTSGQIVHTNTTAGSQSAVLLQTSTAALQQVSATSGGSIQFTSSFGLFGYYHTPVATQIQYQVEINSVGVHIVTPDVQASTATVGQVLTLQNAVTGEVEFQDGGGIYTVDNGLTENPTGNFQLGGSLLQDTNIDGGGSGTWKLDFTNLYSSTNTARYLYQFETSHAGNTAILTLNSEDSKSTFSQVEATSGKESAIQLLGTELRVQTPGYTAATNGDVLTLLDNTTGAAEWQTPTTTTGDSLSPLLLMGG
jgi:hypothetical protein